MPFVVYNPTEGEATGRPIVRLFETQAAANTAAATEADWTAYNGEITDNAVDVDWYINPTNGSVTATLPTTVQTADQRAAWKVRLAQAFRIYKDPNNNTSRQTWWESERPDSAAGRRPLRATDRWAITQIALGSQIADSVAYPTLNDTQREAAIAHIETVISTLGKVWYGVMVGDTAKATSWAATSLADGAPIYSDIITNTGGTRSPDGSFLLLNPVVSIPTGFAPDTDTLR